MTHIHRIVNAETGEVIEKDYTKEELDQLTANQARIDTEIAEAEARATAKAALLEQLGITEEQAKLLLGGN